VQELIGRVLLPAFRARTGKFHGAGREDVDVRMLGRGRPFVYELVAPRQLGADLDDLRRRIHELAAGRIELDALVPVARHRVAYWKEGRFDKRYRAGVHCDGAPDLVALERMLGAPIRILQRTPERVAHRRADLARERSVTIERSARGADGRLELVLRCSHGTYVKEWISGEGGRTQPSLPDLARVPCRCDSLDVLEILVPDSTAPDAARAGAAGVG
jgi:tRNA pseudouridine synthase 10